MSVIRFDTNVPQEVALKFDTGKEVESQFGGSQVLFTLAAGDTMYVPPIVASKIKEAGIQKMELFRICKREVREGNKKSVRWEVSKLGDAAEPPDPTAGFDEMPTDLERKLETSIQQANQQKAQRVASPSKVAPAAPTQSTPEKAQQTQNTVLSTVGQTSLSQLLSGCMVAAIDAAVVARDYAHSKGLTISLTEQSIQDLTSTLMIHVQRMAELECKFDVKASAAMNRIQQGGGVQWRQ